MENFIRKISITFIICMFAIILIFIGINYQSNEEVKNLKEDKVLQKDENNNEIAKEKKEKENINNKEKKDSKEENTSNTKSDVEKNMGSNEDIENYDYNNNSNNTIFNSKDSNVYNSYNQQSYIQVEKFSARINNNRLYIGETVNINTEIYPEDATEKNVVYTSSNKNIAIVSKSGIVTGVNVGDCEITISLNNSLSGKLKIHVLPSNNTIYKDNDDNKAANNESIVEYAPQNIITNEDIIQENNNQDIKESVNDNSVVNQSTTQNNNKNISDNNVVNNEEPITNDDVKSPSNVYDNQSSQNEVQIPNNISNEDKKQQDSQPVSIPQTQKKEEKIKNGWITENGKKYYYKNNKKLKDTYVDYIYLNNKGIAQDKIGNFSATLYGATAWANQKINMRKNAKNSSEVIKIIPVGGKMKILSSDDSNSKYIKVKYGDKEGYVYSDYIYINLPDVIPDAIYEITNANKSIFKSADKNISGVTGKNLYGFTKKKNEKIGKSTYYAPLLYPVAKQFQKAYNTAQKEGYNIKNI